MIKLGCKFESFATIEIVSAVGHLFQRTFASAAAFFSAANLACSAFFSACAAFLATCHDSRARDRRVISDEAPRSLE